MRKKESVNQESKGRNHMSLMSTEQHVSAQVWTCTRCGGEDPKSCGCAAATATSREIREKLATKYEQDRQRAKAYRERSATGQLARAKSVLADNPGISANKLKKLTGSNIAMCRRALRETASRDALVENTDESQAVPVKVVGGREIISNMQVEVLGGRSIEMKPPSIVNIGGKTIEMRPVPADTKDDIEVEDPEVVKRNCLDTLDRHHAVAEAYRKVFKRSSFDDTAVAELRGAIDRLMQTWAVVRSTLEKRAGSSSSSQ